MTTALGREAGHSEMGEEPEGRVLAMDTIIRGVLWGLGWTGV